MMSGKLSADVVVQLLWACSGGSCALGASVRVDVASLLVHSWAVLLSP